VLVSSKFFITGQKGRKEFAQLVSVTTALACVNNMYVYVCTCYGM
jgi:hypothetical protein